MKLSFYVLVCLLVGLCVSTTGCTTKSRNSEPGSLTQLEEGMRQIETTSRDPEQNSFNRRQRLEKKLHWAQLPDAGSSSSLPEDLTGTTFYSEEGTEVECTSASEVTIKIPSKEQTAIEGTYTVADANQDALLTVTYEKDEEQQETDFRVLRSGRKVTLAQQGAQTSGLPAILRGTLPEEE